MYMARVLEADRVWSESSVNRELCNSSQPGVLDGVRLKTEKNNGSKWRKNAPDVGRLDPLVCEEVI